MIQALVLRKGNQIDFVNSQYVGVLSEIPTPAEKGRPDGDFYALPTNEGFVSDYNTLIPYNPANSPNTPLPEFAIPVFKLSCLDNSDSFIVIGTSLQYVTASSGGAALPTSLAYLNGSANPYNNVYYIHGAPTPYGLQTIYSVDSNGNANITIPLPTLSGSLQLFPYGNVNGTEAYPTASIAGTTYATPANLLTFVNAHWTTIGSTTITWSLSSDNLTLIGTVTNFSPTTPIVFGGGVIAVNSAL